MSGKKMKSSEGSRGAAAAGECDISKLINDNNHASGDGDANIITDSVSSPNASGMESSADVDFEQDGVMIGVEIFEESDLDTDVEANKVQFYSDGGNYSSVGRTKGVKSGSKVKQKIGGHREPHRLTLEERIKCIRMSSRYKSYADVQKAWRQKYNTEPPCRKTLSALDKKFQKTGSVADLVRTGRPKSTRTEATVAKVEEAVRRDPGKSIRSLAKDLRLNPASVHRIKKEFEDKRHTLKAENRKLKDRLNEALKRYLALEKKFSQTVPLVETHSSGLDTLFITSDVGRSVFPNQSSVNHPGTNLPIITLNSPNSANGQIAIPSILRLQQPGEEIVHIITLPQSATGSQQLFSFEESSQLQLASVPVTVSQNHNNISLQTANPVYSVCHEHVSSRV